MKRTEGKLELIARKIDYIKKINLISSRDDVSPFVKQKEITDSKGNVINTVDGYLCIRFPTSNKNKNIMFYILKDEFADYDDIEVLTDSQSVYLQVDVYDPDD